MLVTDLIAAKVPIQQIDSPGITMAARALDSVEQAERMANDSSFDAGLRFNAIRLQAQLSRDLQKWLELICATPGARARIGIKAAPEKKLGPLALMLAAKQRAVQHGS
jgi:hypothetical protein